MFPLFDTGEILGGVWRWGGKNNNTDLFNAASNYLLSSSSLREKLADLYQAIHSSANTTLLQQYEEIIHSLLTHIQDNRLECEQLETSFKR